MTFVITNRHESGLNRIPSGPPKLNPYSYQARGLVGWWPGNVDAGQVVVRDYSGRDNHATWTTAQNGQKSGQGFGAIVPDHTPTNDVPVGDAAITELQSATYATLSIWYRRTESASRYAGIGYGVDGSNRFHLGVWSDGKTYAPLDATYKTVTTAPSDTEWHHGVITFDGSQVTTSDRVRVYIDGVAMTLGSPSSGTYGDTLSSSASNRVRLGHPVTGSGSLNDALWFDARAYNRTLSEAEAKDQYFRARWDLWDTRSRTYFMLGAGVGPSTYNETIAETFSFVDAPTRTAVFARTLAEALTLIDSTTGSAGGIFNETIAETLSLVDTATRTGVYNRLIAESLALIDAASSEGGSEIAVSTKGGQSMTLRQMRRLEREQLLAMIRDDDEIVIALVSQLLAKGRRLN